MKRRLETLKKLVEFSSSLDEIGQQLSEYNWDFEGTPIILTRSHIQNAISMFLKGGIDRNELERWANIIEMREDIDFEEANEEIINEVIYCLANPYLEGQLSEESCYRYLRMLDLK